LFNELRNCVWLAKPAPWNPLRGPGQWTDADDTGVTVWLQHRGLYVSSATAAEAINQVARNHPFHPVRDYLTRLTWGHTKRVDGWLNLYFGAPVNEYASCN
jgi:putative DNA primase/helicase